MEPGEAVDILLVEDNPSDMELTIRAIRKRNVANPIHHVEDGAAALDFIFCRGAFASRNPQNPPRIILLDLKLPKISGLEVLKAVKSNEATRAIPVVILTSSKEDPDIERAYALGANSYVVKPVDFDSFSNIIGELGFYWLLINQPPKIC